MAHFIKSAALAPAGVFPRTVGTYCWLCDNSGICHIEAEGSGSFSIISLYYQVEKSLLGEKYIQK